VESSSEDDGESESESESELESEPESDSGSISETLRFGLAVERVMRLGNGDGDGGGGVALCFLLESRGGEGEGLSCVMKRVRLRSRFLGSWGLGVVSSSSFLTSLSSSPLSALTISSSSFSFLISTSTPHPSSLTLFVPRFVGHGLLEKSSSPVFQKNLPIEHQAHRFPGPLCSPSTVSRSSLPSTSINSSTVDPCLTSSFSVRSTRPGGLGRALQARVRAMLGYTTLS